LKSKKIKPQKDAEALEMEADDLAVKAEEQQNLTCVAKSNSLHKTAKQKLAEIKEVELQMEKNLAAAQGPTFVIAVWKCVNILYMV
jgi:hypothetical protein